MTGNKYKVKTEHAILLEDIRNHPRLVELHFTLLYRLTAFPHNKEQQNRLNEGLCRAYNIDYKLFSALASREADIIYASRKFDEGGPRERMHQEVTILSLLNNETLSKASRKYLRKTKQLLYKPEFKLDYFFNKEWTYILDEEIILCGEKKYKKVAEQAIAMYNDLGAKFHYVSQPTKGI